MIKLENKQTQELIASAIKAGTKNPSIEQLTTLAMATGRNDAYRFLSKANLNDKVAVKNCIASMVFGKEPEKVVENTGTVFGQLIKDAKIALEENVMGRPEKAEPVKEELVAEQKSIKERKKTEEFHPETSDRKNQTPFVSESLKVKMEPKHKEIIERGPKEQEKRAKADDREATPREKTAATEVRKGLTEIRDMVNKVAGGAADDDTEIEVYRMFGNLSQANAEGVVQGINFALANMGGKDIKTAAVDDPHGEVNQNLNRNHDSKPEAGEGEHDAIGKEDKLHEEQEALMTQTGDFGKVRGTIVAFSNRIKRGENVEKVIAELVYNMQPKVSTKIRWAFKDSYADLGVGDTVSVQTESGNANVMIDTIGKDNMGKPTLIGKDNTNQIRIIPSGTQVQTVTDPNQLEQPGQNTQTAQTMAPATSTPAAM